MKVLLILLGLIFLCLACGGGVVSYACKEGEDYTWGMFSYRVMQLALCLGGALFIAGWNI